MQPQARHIRPDPVLYLASASPRRQELLQQLGIEFEVFPSNIHEEQQPGETPQDYVRRVARDKAQHVACLVAERRMPVRPVLGADTEVVLGAEIFGKPRSPEHAAQMLSRLAGRSHTVLTALSLHTPAGETSALSESRVTFGPLTEPEIARYVATGEADGKAGAYAIQGRAAGFIARLEGSYSGVMGLPLYELHDVLKKAGVEWP
jgi:septum formation protein